MTPQPGQRWVVRPLKAEVPLRLEPGTHLEYLKCDTATYADGNIAPPGEFWGYVYDHRLRVLDGPRQGRVITVVLMNDDPWPEWLSFDGWAVPRGPISWPPGFWPPGLWRIVEGDSHAHLFKYGDPNRPRCEADVERANTRPATADEPFCQGCEDWYLFNVQGPAHA